ncbi:tetratricopeptide repeat protein [Yeosuana marina]|uniref:tetratricopeptide repeat protein n=1 Tax=Yeosuana marina TaxID=1565536 RepID=UPI0014227A1F|nr:tetratricopeptide repeat protein [Yeosuana marina]|tara:strand:+ start:2461 stop:3714 length:1254 start_codon:yes stop_codon:yes gene_type:complete
MKNQVIIALAFLISTFSFGQKKELRAVEKSIKSNNYAEAKASLSQLESMLPTMEDKYKSEYYYLKGQAFYANGAGSNKDIDVALESIGKVTDGYTDEISELKRNMVNHLLTKGNEAYEKKDYVTSSHDFENAYRASVQDTVYLYYAAATAVNYQDYDRALKLYKELKDLGYTGIEKQYYAVKADTGEEELFQNKNMRDLSVKAKTHIKPSDRMTESKKAEIVKNIALIYVSKDDNEKALEAMKDARAESPDDINLILSEANVYYKMGNKEEFKKLLELATTKDPKNPELQYNLGVIASESEHPEDAKTYYNKAIELDPTYINAYINLAALILNQEQPIIEEMNSLGTSKADNLRYDELREKRQGLYEEAVPYLEKALDIDSKNLSAAKTLMNIYSVTGETAKYKTMKAKVESIENEN